MGEFSSTNSFIVSIVTGEIYDKYGDHVTYFPDVPEILENLTQEGYVVAAASRLEVVHTEYLCVCVCVCGVCVCVWCVCVW